MFKWICDIRKKNSLPKTKEIPMPEVKAPRKKTYEQLEEDIVFLNEVITVVNEHLILASGKPVDFDDHRVQTAVNNARFFCQEQRRKKIEAIRDKLTKDEIELIDNNGIIK